MPRKVHKGNEYYLFSAGSERYSGIKLPLSQMNRANPSGWPCCSRYGKLLLALGGFFAAQVGQGRPQIFMRIDRGVVDTDLVVKV